MFSFLSPWRRASDSPVHEKLFRRKRDTSIGYGMNALISAQLAVNVVGQLCKNSTDGDIVWCGVGNGLTVGAVANALRLKGESNRNLHFYDQFLHRHSTTHDRITQQLIEAKYRPSQVFWESGCLLDNLATGTPDRISMLSINLQSYHFARRAMEILFPRLSGGGILIVENKNGAPCDYLHRLGIEFSLQRYGWAAKIAPNTTLPN